MMGGRPHTSWRKQLLLSDKGKARALFRNAVICLRENPAMLGVLGFDEFALTTMLLREPPWEMPDALEWKPRPWTPHDDLACCDWLQSQGIFVTTTITAEAVELVARDSTYHPVRDYLNSCEWDGTKRLNTLLSVYFGADLNAYTMAVGRMMMIAAVARALDPGCKADMMMILEAKQGMLKSSAIKALFGPEFFTDEIADLASSKDASMQVCGVWVIEVAELDAMSTAEVSRIKSFISRTVDRFRPPYGRRVISHKRANIFIGTCNDASYLKDATGNRRFNPIAVGVHSSIDVEGVERDRDLLWAEAVQAYEAGEPWWFTSQHAAAAAMAADEQEARFQVDPWEALIADYLDSRCHNPPDFPAYQVDLRTVFRQGVNLNNTGAWDQRAMNRIARIMQRLGWRRRQVYVKINGELQRKWLYCRSPTEAEAEQDVRQAEVDAAKQAGEADNVTNMKRQAPDAGAQVVTPKSARP